MKRQRLTPADIGAWVFKGNPEEWDYFKALEDDRRRPGTLSRDGWTVGKTYRTFLIKPGDLMVLWVTGRSNPGIYEIGVIAEEAQPSGGIEQTHLVNKALEARQAYAVDYKGLLLKQYVSRDVIKSDRILRECEQFRAPQISNPTYLTPRQRDALLRYVPDAQLRKAAWPLDKSSARR